MALGSTIHNIVMNESERMIELERHHGVKYGVFLRSPRETIPKPPEHRA